MHPPETVQFYIIKHMGTLQDFLVLKNHCP